MVSLSGVVLKNEVGEREVGERLKIEVETIAKSAILQEFWIVRKKVGEQAFPRVPPTTPLKWCRFIFLYHLI